MLKNIELAAHFRLPKFPPSSFTLALLITNLTISCLSLNQMVFQFFGFLYGMLILYRAHTVQVYLKIIIFLNSFMIWSWINGIVLTRFQQNLVFYTVILIFSKNLILIAIGVFKALFFMKPVEFDDVYWIIQFGTISQYLKYFLEMKILRLLPSSLRIMQNLRVGNRAAKISCVRYACHFTRELLTTGTTQWIILSIFVGCWQIYNNYVNQFGMARVFERKGICIYPRGFLLFGFIFTSISQFSWAFAGRYASLISLCRKIIWNYLRIQCRLSDLYTKYAKIEIMSVCVAEDLSNIIY